MPPRIIAISLCAVLWWAALSAAWAPGRVAGASADWRLEFYTDLNIPTGTPFESIGSLNRTNTAALAGRPAVQLPKSELLKRKLGGGFGGISGLTFNPATGTLYALPDSASPMLFTLKAAIEGGELHLTPLEAIGLTNPDGERIAPWVLDPEGIALTPWGSLIVSSEGYTGRTPPVDPALVEFTTEGKLLRYLPVPDKFLRKGGERQTSGVRHNLGFESLSISTDGRRMFTANEGPLVQDGERCGVDRGCLIRIVEYEVKGHTVTPLHEYGYSVDAMPLPEDLRGASGAMGVADILAVSDSDLLVLERGFASVGETGKNLLTHASLPRPAHRRQRRQPRWLARRRKDGDTAENSDVGLGRRSRTNSPRVIRGSTTLKGSLSAPLSPMVGNPFCWSATTIFRKPREPRSSCSG